MSESVRSVRPVGRTSMAFATAVTSPTRKAASSADHFLVYESTPPVSVTTPFLTATPISLGLTRASHLSSPSTSRWTSSSERAQSTFIALAVAIELLLLLVAAPARRLGHGLHLVGARDLPDLDPLRRRVWRRGHGHLEDAVGDRCPRLVGIDGFGQRNDT